MEEIMDPLVYPRISEHEPLVSVISITYNHEPYIRDCLEGFLSQKTSFPVEYIIHDDASTDRTADILREYYEKRPDLFHIIIERDNQYSQGKDVTLPLYNIARGKYVAFCEGDDFWIDPNKLQKQFDFIRLNESKGLVGCVSYHIERKNSIDALIRSPYKKNILPKDMFVRHYFHTSTYFLK